MTFYFHPAAEIEFNNTINYYESSKRNLGVEFASEIYKTIERIMEYPNAWTQLDNDIRRCISNRFPFGVIYYRDENKIIILAIMQLSREPNYWKNRY